MRPGHALVLFSGGQDSTTCLAWALTHFEHVETIGFDYGQRHQVELQARTEVLAAVRERFPQWAGRLGKDHMVDLAVLGQISDTALTRDTAIQMTEAGLPNTFVPGRNLLFFQLAAAVGYRRGLHTLVGGMCETDFSGYPDCRDEFVKALNKALELGMEYMLRLDTPLMWLNKAETWALADYHGKLDLVREQTLTCYNGILGTGCGNCDACNLRARGLNEYLQDKAAVMQSLKQKLQLS